MRECCLRRTLEKKSRTVSKDFSVIRSMTLQPVRPYTLCFLSLSLSSLSINDNERRFLDEENAGKKCKI